VVWTRQATWTFLTAGERPGALPDFGFVYTIMKDVGKSNVAYPDFLGGFEGGKFDSDGMD